MNSSPTTTETPGGRAGTAAALLLTALVVSLLARLGGIESWVYDTFQRYQYEPASARVVLVVTDREDPQQSDLWKAEGFGELVTRLNAAGAEVIAASEPLRLPDVPPAEQIAALAELERQATRSGAGGTEIERLTRQLAGFRRNYDARENLMQQLKAAGNVVLSAHPDEFRGAESLTDACAGHGVNRQAVESDVVGMAPPGNSILMPPAAICDASRAVGIGGLAASVAEGAPGAPLLVRIGDSLLPSLPLAVTAALTGGNSDIVVAAGDALTLDDRVFRTGPGFAVLPRSYSNPDGSPGFAVVPAAELLAADAPDERLTGSVVLIGRGDADNANVPSASLLASATALSNLLQNDYLLRPAWLNWLEYGMLAAILILVLLWLPGMPAVGAALVGLVIATMVLSIQAWLLVSERIWVQFGTASLFTACAVWVASAVRAWYAARQRATRPAAAGRNASRPVRQPAELDLQFSVLRQQAVTDDSKEKMYQIAFQHGRAEEFAKAERVLRFIYQHDPDYKDVAHLLEKLSGQSRYKPPNRPDEPATPAPPAAEPAADTSRNTLGRYTIERKLGQGAMATVYLGTDPKIGRKVAIKTVALAEEFDDAKLEEAKLQFLREAESAGRLNHPNIIAIYDVGEDQDVSYLAMEYFDGVSLLKHTERDNLLPASWVLELAARAAEALDYAHRQGVVHRDIKPANIMYHAASDEVKLTDFGIARLTDTSRTKTGIILGTPSFMSPEQLTASGVTGQSDLYSLGVTLYQLLTGVAPFRADSIPKLMDKIMREAPRPVSEIRDDLPPCVDSIIGKALAKEPEDRYSSGRAMATELRDCAAGFGGAP